MNTSFIFNGKAAVAAIPLKAEKINSLQQFLIECLRRINYTEGNLGDLLLKLKGATSNNAIHKLIQQYEHICINQKRQIYQVFEVLDQHSVAKSNAIVSGLAAKTKNSLETETVQKYMLADLVIVMTLQLIVGYKIASYRNLALIANTLKLEKIKAIFLECMENEKTIEVFIKDYVLSTVN